MKDGYFPVLPLYFSAVDCLTNRATFAQKLFFFQPQLMPTYMPFLSSGMVKAVLTIIMPNTENKRPPPFSLRLTPEERQQLENQAAGLSLGAYVKARLFQSETGAQIHKPRTRGKFPVKDHTALAEVLAKLGASRLASNLNQLAKAVNSGSLPVTPETESALQAACRDIRAIKRLLMTALGIQER